MAQPTMRPPKTLDDYLALPDDVRAELIAGDLYVTPGPSLEHQRVVLRLLRRFCDACELGDRAEVLASPLDVHLPTGDVVQPDIVVVGADQGDICRPDGVHGAPRLLVEVVSPTHPERDRLVKRGRYARAGVAEYWIVDPVAESVEVFILVEDEYTPAGWFTGDARVESPALPHLRLRADRLFSAPS